MARLSGAVESGWLRQVFAERDLIRLSFYYRNEVIALAGEHPILTRVADAVRESVAELRSRLFG